MDGVRRSKTLCFERRLAWRSKQALVKTRWAFIAFEASTTQLRSKRAWNREAKERGGGWWHEFRGGSFAALGRASRLITTLAPEDALILFWGVGFAPKGETGILDGTPNLVDGTGCGVFAHFHLALWAIHAKRRAEGSVLLGDEAHAFRRGRGGRR